jgi:Na+/proline symporter
VLGIFWKRANKWGASLGMAAGLGVTFYYMTQTQPWLRGMFGVTSPIAENIWWGIQPISAGVFGVPIGFAVIILVSLVTPAPSKTVQELVGNEAVLDALDPKVFVDERFGIETVKDILAELKKLWARRGVPEREKALAGI